MSAISLENNEIVFAGQTDTGRQRKHNEDSLFLPERDGLLVVADGMGGHDCGDVASQLAVATIRRYFDATSDELPRTWPFLVDHEGRGEASRLATAIKLANSEIFDKAKREGHPGGMGTTIVAAYFTSERVWLAHVGDSRIYRIRDREIVQMTEDHSLLNDYIKMKRISPDDVESFPHRNVIVRALGMKEHIKVDLFRDDFVSGDIYVLCTDGLSGMVSDEIILHAILAASDMQAACTDLVDRANANGGSDNITIAIAQVV